jgi:dynein heavy chain
MYGGHISDDWDRRLCSPSWMFTCTKKCLKETLSLRLSLTRIMSDSMSKTVLEMQPRDASGRNSTSKEGKVKIVIDEMLEKLPDNFNVLELVSKVEERTPYKNASNAIE